MWGHCFWLYSPFFTCWNPLKLSIAQYWIKWCLTWDNTGEGNTWYSLEEIIVLIIACYFEKESFIWWYKVRNIPYAIRFSIWVIFNRNSLKRTAWDIQKFKTIHSGWDWNSRSIQQHIGWYSYKRKVSLLLTSNTQLRFDIEQVFELQ